MGKNSRIVIYIKFTFLRILACNLLIVRKSVKCKINDLQHNMKFVAVCAVFLDYGIIDFFLKNILDAVFNLSNFLHL